MIKQGDLLMAAYNLLNNDRQEERGDMLPNYERAARVITALTDKEFTVYDILLVMTVVKMVRELKKHNLDNIVDGLAYFGEFGRAREGI